MQLTNIRIYALAALLFLLTGCAGKQALRPIDPASAIPLSELNHWHLKARVAITTPEDNVTASLYWQKDQSLFDFMLSGSFGVTIVHLIQEDDKASLEIPDTEKLTHVDAQLLLQQTLGWNFPIDALSYWVKGLPSGKPGEQVNYDEKGQLTSINLGHWQIDFSKYKHYQGYLLPRMIKATHPAMSLKVVTKKWLFLE